uniref:Uncharacterized protein n=1 Tax=Lepeophtheirus salmonis TaxID=72036 RepID=A0A0K2T681_LEPSM
MYRHHGKELSLVTNVAVHTSILFKKVHKDIHIQVFLTGRVLGYYLTDDMFI